MAESVSERELRVRRRDERRTLEELEETRKELAEMKQRLAAEERRVGELLAERRQTVEIERNVEMERDTSRKKERNISSGNSLLDTFGEGVSAVGVLGDSVIPPSGDVAQKTVYGNSLVDNSLFPPYGDETQTGSFTLLSTLTDRRESVLRDLDHLCGDSEYSPSERGVMKSTPLRTEHRHAYEEKLERGRQILEKKRQQISRREEMKKLRLKVEAEKKLLEEEQRLKEKREIEEEMYKLRTEFEEEKHSLIKQSRAKMEKTLQFERERLRRELEDSRRMLEEEERFIVQQEVDREKDQIQREMEHELKTLKDEQRVIEKGKRQQEAFEEERKILRQQEEDAERDRRLTALLEEERELIEQIRAMKLETIQQTERKKETQISIRLAKLRKEKEDLEQKLRITRVQEQERFTPISEKPLGKPKLPEFNGSQFEEWKIEIDSLLETKVYSESSLTQVVRNSISGKARRVLLTLPPSATTRQILRKMEDLYGNIRSGDSIVYDFYAAKQEKDETCSDWGIRIETLFNKAVERGEVLESRKDVKVKERFWRGLYSEKIREATRNCFESSDSFDQLRRKARIEELERSTVKVVQEQRETETKSEPKEYVNVQSASVDTKYDTLLNKIASLETSLEKLRSESSFERENSSYRGRYPYKHRGDRRQDWRNNKREDNSASRLRNDKPPNKPRPESQKGDKAQNSSKAEPKKEEEKKDDKSLN